MEHRVEQQQEQEQAPKLCIKHCGFYGNPACLDMCSKCFREHIVDQQKQEGTPVAAPPAAAEAAAVPVVLPKPVEVVPETEEPIGTSGCAEPAAEQVSEVGVDSLKVDSLPTKPVQANRSRCFCCNKKVGLLGFECRCGYVYCSSHRYANEHSCTFDYKTMDREKLAKANPTVAAARVDKF